MVARGEEVERAGLAIVHREHAGSGALLRWQAGVDLRHRGAHRLPAEAIAEVLWEAARRLLASTVVAGSREKTVVAHEAGWRQQRHREGREEEAAQGQRGDIRRH